jgi:hypothetical protein
VDINIKAEQVQPIADKRSVERSTIEFPYLDLENSFEIAEGVHSIGGSSCEWDQLAGHFKQAAQGGGFRLRLICAKQFGLVAYDRGRIELTNLGLRSVDSQQQKAAKAEAFLNISLYKAVYDKFRGNTLPPIAGLEREMVNMGVATKQKDKARQAFHRSAKYAGFFEFGADRLVAPSLNSVSQLQSVVDASAVDQKVKVNGSNVGEDLYSQHPFIVGLLSKLPEPESQWSAKDRAKWLITASNIFDMMYTGSDDGEITVSFTANNGGAA